MNQSRIHALFKESGNHVNREAYPWLNLFSSQRVSEALPWLDGVSPTYTIPNRQEWNLRYRIYLIRTGILTGFPFAHWELPVRLGSPYSGLINVAQKTVCYAAPRIFT